MASSITAMPPSLSKQKQLLKALSSRAHSPCQCQSAHSLSSFLSPWLHLRCPQDESNFLRCWTKETNPEKLWCAASLVHDLLDAWIHTWSVATFTSLNPGKWRTKWESTEAHARCCSKRLMRQCLLLLEPMTYTTGECNNGDTEKAIGGQNNTDLYQQSYAHCHARHSVTHGRLLIKLEEVVEDILYTIYQLRNVNICYTYIIIQF